MPVLGLPAEALVALATLGVGLGLLVGKVVGVFGFSLLAIRLGLADMAAYAGPLQLVGTALLCGIGFTMSLFITLLAFPGDPLLQAEAKIGILAGSLVSGVLGYALLRMASPDWPGTSSRWGSSYIPPLARRGRFNGAQPVIRIPPHLALASAGELPLPPCRRDP